MKLFCLSFPFDTSIVFLFFPKSNVILSSNIFSFWRQIFGNLNWQSNAYFLPCSSCDAHVYALNISHIMNASYKYKGSKYKAQGLKWQRAGESGTKMAIFCFSKYSSSCECDTIRTPDIAATFATANHFFETFNITM